MLSETTATQIPSEQPSDQRSSPIVAVSARSSRLVVAAALAPIVVAAAVSLWVSGSSLLQRLTMHFSQNPWESAIIADGWRAAHGQEVYEPMSRGGHATHLYGPLMSQMLGAIFRVTGPSLLAGRIINLASSLIVCGLLIAIFCRRRAIALLAAAALMLGLHYRARMYFVETRPDMTACLLALLAVLCFYRAHRGDSLRAIWYPPGIALLWLAFGFKQTYAAAAGVPIIALIFTRQWTDRRALLFALSPLVAMVALLAAMKFVTPVVFFYTWNVPTMYKVTGPRLALASVELIALSPLFAAMFGWWLFARRGVSAGTEATDEIASTKMLWLLAAVIVGAAAGIPAYAKRGGSYNSLLLGWVPMTAFCIAMLGPALSRIADFARADNARPDNALAGNGLGPGFNSIAAGWFLAALVLVTNFAVPKSDFFRADGAHGGPEYARVIAAAAALNGRVVCPDDPTIVMFAKGEVCRSLEAELDASGRTNFTPGLLAEIGKARWMIRVHAFFDERRFSEAAMHDLGFRRVRGSPFDRTYSLWKRSEPAATSPSHPSPSKRTKQGPTRPSE